MNNLTKEKYKEIEDNFYNDLKNNLKDNLSFYTVTGSMSRDDIIPGWSDIDVLVVINNYNKNNVSVINDALSKNNSNIKIGITVFSYNDFINLELFKDPKTLYSIGLINDGVCKPRIPDKGINKAINKIKNISSWYNNDSLASIMHGYKRALIPVSKYDEKIVYKKLNTILKIILKQKGTTAHNYSDVVNIAKSRLKDFNFNFATPDYIIKNPDTSLKRYGDYVKFLAWLEKYPNF
jgi:predicted nucleotidyltransferase